MRRISLIHLQRGTWIWNILYNVNTEGFHPTDLGFVPALSVSKSGHLHLRVEILPVFLIWLVNAWLPSGSKKAPSFIAMIKSSLVCWSFISSNRQNSVRVYHMLIEVVFPASFPHSGSSLMHREQPSFTGQHSRTELRAAPLSAKGLIGTEEKCDSFWQRLRAVAHIDGSEFAVIQEQRARCSHCSRWIQTSFIIQG